jgi:hypothetical protein
MEQRKEFLEAAMRASRSQARDDEGAGHDLRWTATLVRQVPRAIQSREAARSTRATHTARALRGVISSTARAVVGKDFDYDMEAEALRVSKDGHVATHRGAFFLSTTLAHELVEIDWYEPNRAVFCSAT